MATTTRIAQSGVPVSAVGNGDGNSGSYGPRAARTAFDSILPTGEPTAIQAAEAAVITSTYGGPEHVASELLSSGDLELSSLTGRSTVTVTLDPDGQVTKLTRTADGETEDKSDAIADLVRQMDVFRVPVPGIPKLNPHNPFGYTGVGRNTVDRMPKGKAAALAALKNLRGEPNGGVRAVYLDSKNFPDKADVYGPADGRPLLIVISSGIDPLHIRSGNVIVHAGSSWGHSITAHGDSKVTVISGDGRKSHTTAEDQSEVTLIPGEGSWGYHSAHGTDAKVVIEDVGVAHRNGTPYDASAE